MLHLAAYGWERGIQVLVENLPGRDYLAHDPPSREQVVDVGFVPYTLLRALGERGVGLCVDIGHLYAEMAVDGACETDRFSRVMAAAQELVPYARHLHVSTVVPPWNGTDSHNGFLETDYAQGAVPTREHLLSWLRLFAGHDHSWVIPEPDGGTEAHLANYRLLSEWMEQAG